MSRSLTLLLRQIFAHRLRIANHFHIGNRFYATHYHPKTDHTYIARWKSDLCLVCVVSKGIAQKVKAMQGWVFFRFAYSDEVMKSILEKSGETLTTYHNRWNDLQLRHLNQTEQLVSHFNVPKHQGVIDQWSSKDIFYRGNRRLSRR
jgi:hypothetical protein